MFLKKFFGIAALVITGLQSQAQINQLNRIEIDYKNEFDNVKIVPIDENGVLLFAQSDEKTKGKSTWFFRKYNTDFEEQEEDKILIDKKMRFKLSYADGNSFHVLFMDPKNKFEIVSLDGEDGRLLRFAGVLPKKANVDHFIVIGDWAITKGIFRSEQQIFAINWKTGESKIIPIIIDGFKPREIKIKSFQLLKDHNEMLVYVAAHTSQTKFDQVILVLDENADLTSQHRLTEDIEKNIVEISGSKLSEDKYVFTGTYAEHSLTHSNGLFMAVYEDETLSFMDFYNFADLENFFSFLPEKKQEKMSKKKSKSKSKGKELQVYYQINFSQILERDGGYMVIGECYYPTYSYQNKKVSSTDANGRITYTNQQVRVFDGYVYTHALAAMFNEEGTLEWSQSIKLNISENPYFRKRYVHEDEGYAEGLQFVYNSGNNFYSIKVNNEGEVIQNEKYFFKLHDEFFNVTTFNAFAMPWYDNYYISFGFQNIKLNNPDEKNILGKKKILFMNKVEVE